jgi:uncharacterized membrane protein
LFTTRSIAEKLFWFFAMEVQNVNYVLAGCYGVMLLAGTAKLSFDVWHERRSSGSCSWSRRLLYSAWLVFLSLCRTIYFSLPVSVYVDIYYTDDGAAIQTWLDMMPEGALVSLHLLLVVAWLQVFAKTRRLNASTRASRLVNARLWMRVYWVSVALLWLGIAIMVTVIAATDQLYAQALEHSGAFVLAVAVAACVATAATFVATLARCARFPMRRHALSPLARHLALIVLVTTFALLVKGVFAYTLNSLLVGAYRKGEVSAFAFAIVWFFYYALTELAPLTYLLVLLVRYQLAVENLSLQPVSSSSKLSSSSSSMMDPSRDASLSEQRLLDDQVEEDGVLEKELDEL